MHAAAMYAAGLGTIRVSEVVYSIPALTGRSGEYKSPHCSMVSTWPVVALAQVPWWERQGETDGVVGEDGGWLCGESAWFGAGCFLAAVDGDVVRGR